MKWFGRKAGGLAARPALARGFGVALGGGDWPRSYEVQVRDAYAVNPVAQRAVRLVAESVGSAPIACSEGGVARLVAATSAGQGLVETVAANLLLHGNAFVQLLSGADGRPVELFALRPDRVTIEVDARGWPGAYLYRVGEVMQRIDPAAIIHIRTFHPSDDHYGLGCLGAASGAVAIHNAATRWNKALLDNAARPSGALVYDPGDGVGLSADQFERFRGRRGTGWAAGGHHAGERFVLIEPDTLLSHDPGISAAGGTVRLLASGIGDAVPVETSAAAIGEALRAPAPVHLNALRRDDGGFDLSCVRSSRTGWAWLDGVDAPLGEDREAYRLTIARSDGLERTYELASAGFHYPASDAAEDEAMGPTILVSVVQVGTGAVSRAATLCMDI